jgi:HEAT repeat protein
MKAKESQEDLAERMRALDELLVHQYMKGLEHASPKVRRKSARGLENLGGLAREAIPRLELLRNDSDRKVREAAASALSVIDTERSSRG